MHSHAERGNDQKSKASRLKPVPLGVRGASVGPALIVPTLRVVTPPPTLCVPRTTHIQAGEVTRSVTGCIPTQSEGTIKAIKINSFPAEAGPKR